MGLALICFCSYYYCLPKQLFSKPVSTILYDKNGHLIGAKIADDGQWRFANKTPTPKKFEEAILTFEDKRFHNHIGVDILAIFRAIVQNVKRNKIHSGASTLSMQLIRMSKNNPKRSIFNKLIEIIQATRLEWSKSKQEILSLYCANAPFGGNVVGLGAAAWRYYGKSASQLSWAESSTLAVLPNSPSLIHPGRNRNSLRNKRDLLLFKLLKNGTIDSIEYRLALKERLPDKPFPLPREVPHLTEYTKSNYGANIYSTTIDREIQNEVNNILLDYNESYKENEIHNGAILVLDNNTGNVISYIGNVYNQENTNNAREVDIIRSGRSSGSILKPILYAYALDDGLITTKSLLPDIPIYINGYKPDNYFRTYCGAVPVEQSLARSLNIPATILLKQYGLDKFLHQLKELEFNTINKSADYYGLPLILGGADVNLWDLCSVYSSFARMLNHFSINESKYNISDFKKANYLVNKSKLEKDRLLFTPPYLSAGSIWLMFEMMNKVERPDNQGNWKVFNSKYKVAWKTGTSFAFKDAWAIGVTKNYTVGVWVGNANGVGRPDLVGAKKAGPILFDVLNLFQNQQWFDLPADDLKTSIICRESGMLPHINCNNYDTIYSPLNASIKTTCNFHKKIRVDLNENFRIRDDCINQIDNKVLSWFELPPLQESYYINNNPNYRKVPNTFKSCDLNLDLAINTQMELIYPKHEALIQIPVDFDGNKGKVIFKAVHRNPKIQLFWHIDDHFIGVTEKFHEIEVEEGPGKHQLRIIDSDGEIINKSFFIIE